MPKRRVISSTSLEEMKPLRPAVSLEGREMQLVSLALDLAEQRLRDGTASSQEVTHFLKLGSTRNVLEQEKLKKENELLDAKKKNLEAQAKSEEMYNNAMKAMQIYSGKDEQIILDMEDPDL